jgi:V/A-type H+-transporting ATPase subunit I
MFERLRDAKNSITLLDPLSQSMTFFVITIALGIIQVIFGLSIRAVKAFMDREPGVAICENISWIFIIVGLISIQVLEGGRTAGTILALTGAGLILVGTNRTTRNPFVRLASGLYGLYGITGFLSDVLSYSRLLALGLTTGVIAMAVNLIGFIVIEIPVLGWILFVLIFVFGHAANLLISSLGAFVHTIRLQYVEFFPKFYTSGGHAFKPFSAERKYTIITEE